MKLFVVSHACATPVNQRLFAEIERQSGWDIVLVAPSTWIDDYGNERTLERLPGFRADLAPTRVGLNGNVPLHFYRSTFRSLLSFHRPDAIYVHHEPYAAATAQVYLANRAWHGCPIGFFTWQNIEKQYPPPFRQLERMVYRTSAFAFSGSESAETVLRSKGYQGPCTLLPGSVNPDAHRPDPSATKLRSRLGIAPEEIVFGFMGRVSKVKGLDTTLSALSELNDFPWRFVVVGDGDYRSTFQKSVDRRGLSSRIICTGYVPHTDAAQYLSMFDVLILPSETQPSWKEQFGRVLVEALACGTPLIGSDSGEIPNVIRRTGGGLTFGEGDPSALRSALVCLGKDARMRSSFASNGRDYVLRHHTDEILAERFVGVIRSAVRGNGNVPPRVASSRPAVSATP
jgi:glycosyltransferase involved in cell wall biosynthesis